jgi:hypothetical protein
VAGAGIALSGGGHRATLFTLGVLLYLADAGKNKDVTSVASVSGGSLTNGYVAQSVDYASVDADEFEQPASRLASQIAQKGTLWATWLTKIYLLALLASVLLPAVGVWFLPLPLWGRVVLLVVGLLVLPPWVAQWRGLVCARAFAQTLFSPNGRPTPLAQIHHAVDHVLCAAELHSGEHSYFSGRFVCSYRFGWGVPGDLPLHDAVQASAAYPGGFPARWFRTDRHVFQQAQDERAAHTKFMTLVDGGAYDNLGDEWGQKVAERNQRWASLNPGLHEPDELVIVNCSAAYDWHSTAKLRLPLLGEVLTLKRDVDILYDVSTSVRRRWLDDLFTAPSGKTPGVIVQIAQSPFRVAESFANGNDAPAQRARAVLTALGDTRKEWAALVRQSRSVKTTLSRIREPKASGLLRHGYVLAMCNLHVILDYPLLPMPDASKFTALVHATPASHQA